MSFKKRVDLISQNFKWITLLVAATLAFLGLAPCLLADIAPGPIPILVILEPLEGPQPHLVFQRIAPKSKGEVDQGRISVKLRVFNTTAETLTIDRVEILGQVVSLLDQVPPNPIQPGEVWTFQNSKRDGAIPLIIDAPFPTSAKVQVFFKGDQNPLSKTLPLAVHVNDDASLSFISRTDDLSYDELWHGSSHHPFNHQVFALDLGVKNWTGSTWSSIYPGANKYEKESFPAYGFPIYAMADGTVCSALGDQPEPRLVGCDKCSKELKPPSTGNYSNGGNHLFIQTGDEISLYAHLQPASIPAEYLTPGATIKRGAYLGKVGFSGNTSGPHVHIHVKKEPKGGTTSTTCDAGTFRPMMFGDISSLTVSEASMMAQNGTLTKGQWTPLDHHSWSHPAGLVYPSSSGTDLCNHCTDDLTYIGVWREGTEIDLRVRVKSWDTFKKKWSALKNDRFHLTDINVVQEHGDRFFIGLFRRGAKKQGLLGLSNWEAFAGAIGELAAQDLQLVDVEVYEAEGLHHWVGVFHKLDADHVTHEAIGFQSFASKWSQLAGQGMALIDLEIFSQDGERHFFGIFAPDNNPLEQKLIQHIGWGAFSNDAADFADEGYHLVDIESFAFGGTRYYTGIFRPGVGTFSKVETWDLFQQTDEKKRNNFKNDDTFYRLIDIHALE